MSDFEEVYDHPDKPGEYLTKAELDEYNAKKELGAGIQKIAEGLDHVTLASDMLPEITHPGSWISVGDKKSKDVEYEGESNNERAKRLVWLDEFDLHFSHPACVRIVEKDIKQAAALKAKGNEYYKQKFFDTAIKYYSRAIAYCPLSSDHSYSRAVFYSNRAACYMSMTEYERAIKDCTAALEFEPKYVKTLLRRCKAYEASDRLEDAVSDIDKVVEIDRGNRKFLLEQHRLQSKLKKKQEDMKKEMMDKLKGLGNTILGKFGMSLDNFKFNQKEDGSYSVNFQQ